MASRNPILKNNNSRVASSIRLRDMLQFQAILRTGFFANSAGITKIILKKELIDIVSPFLKMVKAPVWQSIEQRPQPVHFSLLMMGITSFLARIPFKKSRRVIFSLNPKAFNFSLSLRVQVVAPHFY